MVNHNGYFKCLSCGHYQHTTEFGECEECSCESLTEITQEEYNKTAQMTEPWGKLKVWGSDEDGYWEKTYDCYSHEIDDILQAYDTYEDCDFYEQ